MASSDSPRSSASLRAVSTTNAGSLRLPRLRHWREIRRVSLDQHPISRRDARGLLNVERFGKRHDSAEAEMKSELERLFGLRRSARKAMHDAAETRWRPMLAQQSDRIDPTLRAYE